MRALKKSKLSETHISHFILIGVILTMLILAVLALYLMQFKQFMGQKAYDDVCNQYIKTHMIGKNKFIEAPLSDFPCKTKDETIASKGSTLGGKKYYVMQDVSNKMLSCYNSFERGKKNLFTGEVGEKTNFCAPCYKLTFADKKQQITFGELMEFQSVQGIGTEKYLDIFTTPDFKQRYMNSKKDAAIEKYFSETAIDSSKDYLIVFKYEKIESESIQSAFEQMAKAYVDQRVNLGTNTIVGALVGASAIVVGGVIIVASGGSALLVAVPFVMTNVVPGAIGGGVVGAYLSYNSIREDTSSGNRWTSSIQLIEFNPEKMRSLECDQMIGIQEPGITSRE